MLIVVLAVYVGSIALLAWASMQARDAALVVPVWRRRGVFIAGIALFMSHAVLSMKPSLWPRAVEAGADRPLT